MNEIISPYSIGDRIVHSSYGIGQIKKIEEKRIHEELGLCFQVETKDGAHWWFPRNTAANPRIRPLSSKKLLHRSQIELQKPVNDLDPDKSIWRQRLAEVRVSNDLIAITQLVRDLTILRTQRRLNHAEGDALRHFKARLVSEWAAIMKIDIEIIQTEIEQSLEVIDESANIHSG
jgi:RNA polymerase-interacting CarD/CdnL/TRCF family regulator